MHIDVIDGFSAHKDSDHLLEFVSHSAKTLKKVFKNIKGLNENMGVGPSGVTKDKFDIIIVDYS